MISHPPENCVSICLSVCQFPNGFKITRELNELFWKFAQLFSTIKYRLSSKSKMYFLSKPIFSILPSPFFHHCMAEHHKMFLFFLISLVINLTPFVWKVKIGNLKFLKINFPYVSIILLLWFFFFTVYLLPILPISALFDNLV